MGERRDARVEEVAVAPRHAEGPVVRVEPPRVREDGNKKGDGSRARPGEADSTHDQVAGHRDHEGETDGPCQRGGGEQPAGGRARRDARPPVPEEKSDPTERKELEQRLGHHELLDAELVGVKENGRRGHRRQAGAEAETSSEGVDDRAEREADHVLDRDDCGEVVSEVEHESQEHRIAERPPDHRSQMACVREVAVRVPVEQESRPVREENDGAKNRRSEEGRREQAVAEGEADSAACGGQRPGAPALPEGGRCLTPRGRGLPLEADGPEDLDESDDGQGEHGHHDPPGLARERRSSPLAEHRDGGRYGTERDGEA